MLKVLNHSLVHHYLGILRNKKSSIVQFRFALDRLSQILALESVANFPLSMIEIETPLEKIKAQTLSHEVVVVPILRAGLSMLHSFTHFLPDCQIGFIGQKRDEETAEAFEYYRNYPNLQNKRIIIIDPMLATGGSATATIDSIIEKGGDLNNIQLTCVIAAPEGVSCVESKYPKLPILTATLDRCLNEKKYILPGLGDAGDLWTGTN
jgi:uracil phosphoribosyltransferase